jgi:ABC-type transporter Mla maintaining outer membrane lipid asymmetry ATPase subunit MlaF
MSFFHDSSREDPLSPEPGITFDRVHFAYPGKSPILANLSWQLPRGGSAVITGGVSSGKSTLLYLAAGLLSPARGTVLLSAYPVTPMLPSERFRNGLRIGFVFQEGGLLANLSARANVSLALHYHSDVLGLDEEAIEERTKQALELAHIDRRDWDILPAHMSFGNRKRVALARAMAIRPTYFFFDDPDVGLDQRTAFVIHEILCKLRDDPDVTLVVGTNRGVLMERLEIPGFRLGDGMLTTRTDVHSIMPQPQVQAAPSWPAPGGDV